MNRFAAAVALCALMTFAGGCASGTDPSQLTDDPLVAKVYQAIQLTPDTSATQVTVSNNNGVVTLNGFVTSLEAQREILNAAESVDGVTRVDDNLIMNVD